MYLSKLTNYQWCVTNNKILDFVLYFPIIFTNELPDFMSLLWYLVKDYKLINLIWFVVNVKSNLRYFWGRGNSLLLPMASDVDQGCPRSLSLECPVGWCSLTSILRITPPAFFHSAYHFLATFPLSSSFPTQWLKTIFFPRNVS